MAKYIEKAIEAVSTADNIIFYSIDQIPIFLNDDPRNKKVILFGGYGSEKTFPLRERLKYWQPTITRNCCSSLGQVTEKNHTTVDIRAKV